MPRLLFHAAIVLLLALPALTSAQSLGAPLSTWQPNGEVKALALDGHTLYVGGQFDLIGPATGSFAVASTADAAALTTGAEITDVTSAVAADGADGWFVATSPLFGQQVTVLHIRADGTRDPAWAPPVLDSGVVVGLVVDGGRLLVGGSFTTVNGTSRPALAALDPSSGALLPWDARLVGYSAPPTTLPAAIFSMAATPGRLYVSGIIESVGGVARSRFAVIDTATGDALPGTLAPDVFVSELTATATRVYVRGNCRPGALEVCGYSPDMTPLPGWTFPRSAGPLAAGPTALYSVEVSSTGPPYGLQVVARDLDTGAIRPFAPSILFGAVGTMVSTLAVAGNTLYLGGDFVTVNGQRRWRLAALDATTGALQPWAPLVGGQVRAMAVAGSSLAFGGIFSVAGGAARRNLAALDLRTGRLGAATPELAFSVTSLLKLGSVFVAGGERPFGVSGPDVMAFTSADGALLPWGLESNGAVLALASDGRRLYIGGRFSLLSGALRLNLAALDLGTATLTSWNPQPDSSVTALVVDGPTLFAAGTFSTLRGYGRNRVAAFDGASGDVLSFAPALPPALTVSGFGFAPGRVLVAGDDFASAYGVTPLAWLDRVSGSPVAPLGFAFRTGATAHFGGTLYLAGSTPTGASTLVGIDTASSRVGSWPLAVASQTGIRASLAVNADYVATGIATSFLTAAPNLVVYAAPRAGAPQRMQSAVNGNTVTLGWQPGANPATTAFLVEAGTSAGATDVGVFNVGLSTAVAGALSPGTYFIRVRGVGANGAGAASSEVITSLPPISAPPAAPGPLTASVTGHLVTLFWGAAAGNASSYVVEAGTAAGLTNIGALATGNLDTTWSVPAPAGTYHVRVRAANAHGLGPATNEVIVVVP